MTIIAALTTFVTLIGVVFIWRTLEATSETLKAANTSNDILRQEQRPWLIHEREYGCTFTYEQPRTVLKFKHKMINWGKAPAFSVQTRSKIVSNDFFEHHGQLDNFINNEVQRAKNGQTSISIFPNEKPEFTGTVITTGIHDPKERFFLFHLISYRLWNDPNAELGFDVRVYEIIENNGTDKSITDSHLLLHHRHDGQTT